MTDANNLNLDSNNYLFKLMSNAFNSTKQQPKDVLNDKIFENDKTLKWGALKNNQNAKKNKHFDGSIKLEEGNASFTGEEQREEQKQQQIGDPDDSLNYLTNINTKKKFIDNKYSDDITLKKNKKNDLNDTNKRLKNLKNNDKAIDNQLSNQIQSPKRRGRSKKTEDNVSDKNVNIASNNLLNQISMETSEQQTPLTTTTTVITSSTITSAITIPSTISNNATAVNENEIEIRNDEKFDNSMNITEEKNTITDINKKIRRSTRLEPKTDNATEISDMVVSEALQSDLNIKVHPTKFQNEQQKIFDLTAEIEMEKSPPKKRGRKSKNAPSSPQLVENVDDINKMSTRKTKTPKDLPLANNQRPLRRIKPTPKILENDELRYEFETKNIARITACTDVLSTSPPQSEIETKNQQITPKKDFNNKNCLNPAAQLTPDINNRPQNTNGLKKKLSPLRMQQSALSSVVPPTKVCPDPITFLNEIKAEKLNLNKSPEDKKLNRKQHRKLLKQKEKHLEKLGLKRNNSGDKGSNSNDSTDDNEEFVPNKKVKNVGKPNVTLRIRTNQKDNTYVAIPGPSKTNSTRLLISARPKNRKQQNDLSNSSSSKANSKQSRNKTQENSPGNNLSDNLLHNNREQDINNLICLCHKSSPYFTKNTPDTLFCCAIDNIEDQKVGCCNQLSGELLNLVRPSQRVGYMILCQDHIKRLKSHNCCAGCGIFCTQGKFVLCHKQHFFHVDCAQKFILNSPYDPSNIQEYTSPTLVLKCPHCGQDTPEKTSIVTMKCQSLPVFLPSKKNLIKSAKMTLPENRQTNQTIIQRKLPISLELENLIPESVMNVIVRHGSQNSSANEFTTKDMFYAINNDDLERVAEILSSGYDIRQKMPEFLMGTCLHLVSHFGTVQMTYLLLSHLNCTKCRDSFEDFINDFNKESRTAVMCSIIGGKSDILKLFIQCKANLTLKGPDGMTSLHIAAKVGNVEATKTLIECYRSSANMNSFERYINSQDDGGWTAIVWAAELGFTEIVSLLLNNGANVNITDNEHNSVLHWATSSNHPDTISLLLRSNNLNCSIQNINGDTPLHIACRSQHTRICLLLIMAGAELMIKNKADELPFDCVGNEESPCARAVGFNMQMRSFGPTGLNIKIVHGDISNGRECYPIQVVRNIKNITSTDDNTEIEEIILPDFKYITKSIIVQNSIHIDHKISQMRVCSCSDSCSSDQCQCSTISIQNWYTQEGRLNGEFNYSDPAMIFECSDVCGCNKLMCKNRVVQNGIKLPLQVFECEERTKGWGVRSLRTIPRGTFIAEYIGEILIEMEADRRTDDSYFFDLGAAEHCIDANYYGNVSRFFNHSCSPNIVPVRVYYEHQDFRFPKIAFFASKDVPSGEELCFDYGDKFWLIKQKVFTCKCLLPSCRYSMHISNGMV